MQEILPQVRISLKEGEVLDPASLFDEEVTSYQLEIGFGGGEHLATQAQNNLSTGFLGCEPFVNGMAKLLLQIKTQSIKNIRIFPDDARFLLTALKADSLERVYILFPDPWPKKRHAARRFVQDETLSMLARVLKPSGQLRLATDVKDLAGWMSMKVEQNKDFELISQGHTPPADWVNTRYEQKGLKQGRAPFYAIYRRSSPSLSSSGNREAVEPGI